MYIITSKSVAAFTPVHHHYHYCSALKSIKSTDRLPYHKIPEMFGSLPPSFTIQRPTGCFDSENVLNFNINNKTEWDQKHPNIVRSFKFNTGETNIITNKEICQHTTYSEKQELDYN